MLVKDILKNKGDNVYSINPDQTVLKAIEKLDEYNIGALIVTKDEKLKGIISERDYRSKVILKGRTSENTRVSEIMSNDIYYVSESDTVEECMSIMTQKKIRHLPVLQEDHILGVVSIGDLVKAIISKQKIEITHLRQYIEGGYPG